MNSKLTLFIAALALSVTAFAQPVLTSNTAPVVGYTVKLAAADTNGVTEGPGGANQTWNFSLTQLGTTIYTYTYEAASTTSFASKYPNATIVFNSSSSQGNPGYTYLSASSSVYQVWGVATNDIQLVYSDPQEPFRYPFTTTTSYTDNFAGSGTNSQGLTSYRYGTTTVSADGYGTLTLPGGTFTNVMRMKVIQDFTDSINIFGDDYISKYVITTYNFMHENYRQQLLGISYTEYTDPFFGSTTFTKSVLYYPDGPVSTGKEIAQNNISIYPNPANDYFTLAMPGNNENTMVEITDMAGKTTGSFAVNETAVNIPTGNLPAGIYTVRVSNNSDILSVQKIAVTH